jgi:hypothetical protein
MARVGKLSREKKRMSGETGWILEENEGIVQVYLALFRLSDYLVRPTAKAWQMAGTKRAIC